MSKKKTEQNSIINIKSKFIPALIAASAGISLFLELLVIRMHSSYFQLFAYFKNVSLFAAFLGLGIGYAVAARKQLRLYIVIPMLALQTVALYLLRFTPYADIFKNPMSESLTIGIHQASSNLQIFGVYQLIILVFVFNAIMFVPLGQLIALLMARTSSLKAYGWDLLGGIGGIISFGLLSYLSTPPAVWIIVGAVALAFFLRDHKLGLIALVFSTIICSLVLTFVKPGLGEEYYSPYQNLNLMYEEDGSPIISTRNTFFQRILDLSPASIEGDSRLISSEAHYSFPYQFKPKPDDVLIVGSGAGNDIAAAVRNGAGFIDAVEIDPLVMEFGAELHPEQPYQAENVRPIINDARAYIRSTNKQYDLIVYGLLDSHSLLSSRSGGIRLDSYVYTIEAFEQAKSRLKDDGVLVLSFAAFRPELGKKLYVMLEQVYDGVPPRAFQSYYDESIFFVTGLGNADSEVDVSLGMVEISNDLKESHLEVDPSTDDWPFFYMPVKKYPFSYIFLIGILFVVSVIFVKQYQPDRKFQILAPSFFLGAGFMLLEAKGITELSLFYGSTWIVTSIIIVGVLLMAFSANLFVIKFGKPPARVVYPLLILSILAGYGLTFFDLSQIGQLAGTVILPVVLTMPLFFSGLAFSSEVAYHKNAIGIVLSSNILGAMLGGFLEYNSMYFGFRALYLLAIVMYALAWISTKYRKKQIC